LTIITPLLDGKIVSLQVKIKVTKGSIRTITRLIDFTLSDYSKINYVILEYWELKRENYEVLEFDKLIFIYKILNLESIIKETKVIHPTSIESKKWNPNFGGYSLPETMNMSQWVYIFIH